MSAFGPSVETLLHPRATLADHTDEPEKTRVVDAPAQTPGGDFDSASFVGFITGMDQRRVGGAGQVVAIAGMLAGCARGGTFDVDARANGDGAVQPDGTAGDGARADATSPRLDVPVALPDAAPPPMDVPPPPMDVQPACVERDRGMTCRLVAPQCGCTAGQQCVVDFAAAVAGTRVCVPQGTVTSPWGPCSATSACGPGLECTGPASGSLCREYCDPALDACGPRRHCATMTDAMMRSLPGAGVCLGGCNVLDGSGCPAGFGCQIQSFVALGASVSVGDCGRVGAGAHRDACNSSADCRAGTWCLGYTFPDGSSAGNFCTRICRVGVDADCVTAGTDRRCVRLTGGPVIDSVEYGACGM
jgi:hypothetical protein